MATRDVGVIIPAYNEESRIGYTIRALWDIQSIDEILVVDDGSTDNTAEIASKEGARLLKLNRNYGKGYALLQGIKALSCPIVLLLDADLGERASIEIGDVTMKDMKTVLSGQRGFRRDIINPEFFRYKGFGIEFGMTVDLINRGLRIYEIDVQMTHSVTGMNWEGLMHRARQFRDISSVLLKKFAER